MRSNFTFSIDKSSLKDFQGKCEAAIRNVDTGSKKALTQACEEILTDSGNEVPSKTGALKGSRFYVIRRRTDVGPNTYAYEATLGYGKGNPVNPETGKPVRSYMVAVHERLDVQHPNGKAKFLEDPVRRYGDRFPRTVYTYAKDSLSGDT